MTEQVFNLKFVGEVEKYPVLYNFNMVGYSRKDVTDKAWNDVAKALQITVSECKERWKNLRAVFVRHSKPPPSGSGGKAKKPYYLAEAMQFTLPYIKALGAPVPENFPAITKQEENLPVPTEEDEDSQLETSTFQASSPTPPAQQPGTSGQKKDVMTDIPDSHSQKIGRMSRKRALDDLDNSFMEYLSAKKKVALNSIEGSQAKRMFLLSLLPELEPMTDSQMKLFRRKVLALIDEIMNQPQET